MDWLKTHNTEIVVDPVVLGEIWRGITALPEGRKRTALVEWFHELRRLVPCLDWTQETAVIWGEMLNKIRHNGYTVGFRDTMIAATARRHGLTVATRNVADFVRCGVPVVNPFDE